MHRLPSLVSRQLSRREAAASHPSASSPLQLHSAVVSTLQNIPVLDQQMRSKLAAACRRSSTLAGPLRNAATASAPVAVAAPSLAGSSWHSSPLISPRVTPLATPVATPVQSRRHSFSTLAGVQPASPSSARSVVGLRHRGASPPGLSRVIAPFMPIRFVAHRSNETQTKTREHEKQQQQSAAPTATNVPLYGSRPSPLHPPVDILHKGVNVPLGQVGQQAQQPLAGESTASRVIANVGLSDFLGRVYSTTGWSVAGSLAASYGLMTVLTPAMIMPAMIGGLVVSIGSIVALSSMKPQTTPAAAVGPDSNKLITVNSPARQAVFGLFVGANSLMLTPLVATMTAIHPMIIPAASVLAAAVMAGASLVAYRRPSGSMLAWQGPLTGALLAAILLQVGSMGALYFIGPNMFSALSHTVWPYLTIGIFSAFTAVDTQQAVAEYEKGEAGQNTL